MEHQPYLEKMVALCMTSTLRQSFRRTAQMSARYWNTAALYGVELPALCIWKEPKRFNISFWLGSASAVALKMSHLTIKIFSAISDWHLLTLEGYSMTSGSWGTSTTTKLTRPFFWSLFRWQLLPGCFGAECCFMCLALELTQSKIACLCVSLASVMRSWTLYVPWTSGKQALANSRNML